MSPSTSWARLLSMPVSSSRVVALRAWWASVGIYCWLGNLRSCVQWHLARDLPWEVDTMTMRVTMVWLASLTRLSKAFPLWKQKPVCKLISFWRQLDCWPRVCRVENNQISVLGVKDQCAVACGLLNHWNHEWTETNSFLRSLGRG